MQQRAVPRVAEAALDLRVDGRFERGGFGGEESQECPCFVVGVGGEVGRDGRC